MAAVPGWVSSISLACVIWASPFLELVCSVTKAGKRSAHSPKCLEGGFCELRLDGVLRSSHSPGPMPQVSAKIAASASHSTIHLRCPGRFSPSSPGRGLWSKVLGDEFLMNSAKQILGLCTRVRGRGILRTPSHDEVLGSSAPGFGRWHHAYGGKGWPLGFSLSGSGRRGR